MQTSFFARRKQKSTENPASGAPVKSKPRDIVSKSTPAIFDALRSRRQESPRKASFDSSSLEAARTSPEPGPSVDSHDERQEAMSSAASESNAVSAPVILVQPSVQGRNTSPSEPRFLISSYQPLEYDLEPEIEIPPEEYYGSLIDEEGSPSVLYIRMVDALFFHMSTHTPDKSLRGGDFLNLLDYWWMFWDQGLSLLQPPFGPNDITFYYNAADVPYILTDLPDGSTHPLIDRQAWLQMQVWEAKINPDGAHTFWGRSIRIFNLKDPETSRPFLLDVPRSAFPSQPDPAAQQTYEVWVDWFLNMRPHPNASFLERIMAPDIAGSGRTRPRVLSLGGAF